MDLAEEGLEQPVAIFLQEVVSKGVVTLNGENVIELTAVPLRSSISLAQTGIGKLLSIKGPLTSKPGRPMSSDEVLAGRVVEEIVWNRLVPDDEACSALGNLRQIGPDALPARGELEHLWTGVGRNKELLEALWDGPCVKPSSDRGDVEGAKFKEFDITNDDPDECKPHR